MAVRDIVEIAGDALPSRSKTPDTVVSRDLSMDIKRKGEESRFIRTAPGRYTMREFVTSGLIQMGDSGSTPQPTRLQKSNGAPTIPVLSQALSDERRGVLPSGSVGSQAQEATQLDDVNSL
jgi:hypothetical protein